MIRYEIREICGDWAIYEVRETETEGGERCLLILNSRSNAEYVKAILEHEAKYPNAAVPYRPEVAQMSDAECVAAFRFCCSDSYDCDECQFERMAGCGHMAICRRVLKMAERYVELKKEPVLAHHPKPYEKEIEELTCDMCDSCREAITREDCPNHCCDDVRQHAEALYTRGWRRPQWISVEERLPDILEDYIVVVKHKYEYEDEWEYDVDVGGPALGDDGSIDHFWETLHDWEVGKECHITHWMPLPEPPMMKGENNENISD